MTDQQRRERIQQAIDSTLDGLATDPYLAARVLAHTKENDPMRKGKISMSLLAALVIVCSLVTVAIAAGVSGSVNWLGEILPDEMLMKPWPTVAPDEPDDAAVRFEMTQQLLQSAHAGEVVSVWDAYGGSSNHPSETFDSLQALADVIGGAEYLPRANFIPEGYEFVSGQVLYGCKAGGAYELIGEETPMEGMTVTRYRIPEQDVLIEGYEMVLRDSEEDYHYLSIHVGLNHAVDVTDYAFGINENQTAHVIEVAGMDNALGITADQTCSLYMRRTLDAPIEYRYFDGMMADYIDTYAEVSVSVRAPLLDLNTLAAMFAAQD